MPAFSDLVGHSPLAVAIVGLLSFAGQLGCGLGLMRLLRLRVPSPWREAQAALLGLLGFGLLVQIAGMLAVATRPVLIGLWALTLTLGLPLALARLRESGPGDPRLAGGGGVLLATLGAVAVATNFLLALGPSTKADEIYYHMLLPARLVLDGRLELYLEPWPAAILPGMAFQVAAAPLHALGLPDAPNVVSFCQSLLLSWLGYRLVLAATGDRAWSLLAAVSAQIGLHPSVVFSTGGSHALGELASASALLALLGGRALVDEAGAAAYSGFVATCAVAAASAKISLLPFAVLVTLLTPLVAASRRADRRIRRSCLGAALLPWLVFFLPIAVWTWVASGSPFGPVLAGWTGESVYGENIGAVIARSRIVNVVGPVQVVTHYAISTAAPIWLGMLAYFLLPAGRGRRVLAAGLLGLQLVLIWTLLPRDLRFLAGLPWALFVLALIAAFPVLGGGRRTRLVAAGIALLLVPWLGAQLYRARDLVPASLGLERPAEFARRHVPLWEDFVALDGILPDEAVLYARVRIPSVYAPRPVYFDREDLPAGRRAFVLWVHDEPPAEEAPLVEPGCADLGLDSDCELGPAAYENRRARYRTYRTPGRAPLIGAVQVREILSP